MGAPRLVQVACPGCGAGIRIDPKSDVVTCEYCNKSSFVHRPKEPVLPPPVHQQAYGHIHIPPDAARAVGRIIAIAVTVPILMIVGLVVAISLVRSATHAVITTSPGQAPQIGPASLPAGPSCQRAIACCKAIQPQNAGCDGMGMMGEDACARQVEQLRTAAKALGRSCP